MVDAVAFEVARAELRRAGVDPTRPPLLAWVLMAIAGATGLAALSWLVIPGPAPVTSPEVAVRTLWGSALAVGLFWALGRLWSWERLRDRARHIGMSPNLSPGIWDPGSWMTAGLMSGLLCFMVLAYVAGVRHRESGRDTLVGTVLMKIAGVCIPITTAAAWLSVRSHRKRGGSRFVPIQDATRWLPGQELAGVLEVPSWFGGVPAVLFELVKRTHDGTDGPFEWSRSKWSARVVASVTVRAEAFENPPGLTVVPMTLAVPPDAEPLGETTTGRWFPWQKYQLHSVSWSLRATAVQASAAYQSDFDIAIVAPATITAASRAT